MKHFLPCIILIGLLAGCKKEVDSIPGERPFSRDFYVQGAWRDTFPNTIFNLFDYTVGMQSEPPSTNQFNCKSSSAFINGLKTIRADLFGINQSHPLFSIQFSVPGSDANWTEEALSDLLAPGTTFPISGNPGEVSIGFVIITGLYYHSDLLSLSDNAPNPSGAVTILESTPYSWTSGNLVHHQGFKVKVQFHTNLGRLNYVNAQQKVVGEAEIKDGEASLFFEY